MMAGRSYLWCACGRSARQPLCDGSHKGGNIEPMLCKSAENLTVALCGCKQTQNPPFCDGSHTHVQDDPPVPQPLIA
jgi:CDGSH-type Zn-finger protein